MRRNIKKYVVKKVFQFFFRWYDDDDDDARRTNVLLLFCVQCTVYAGGAVAIAV